jgi:hypothetical protein
MRGTKMLIGQLRVDLVAGNLFRVLVLGRPGHRSSVFL